MHTILQDIRYAARQLLKNPGFTFVAVLTLALGIGANTAIFSVVNGVLLRPLALPSPDRLAVLWTTWEKRGQLEGSVSGPNFLDWKQQTKSFSGMAAFKTGDPTFSGDGAAERVHGGRVTADFFTVLGVTPALGRAFALDEDRQGAADVVVISDGLWHRRFGASPSAVGRQVTISGQSFTIIGVLPAGFEFPLLSDAEAWVPLTSDTIFQTQRGNNSSHVIARLKPGASLASANDDLRSVADRLARTYPKDDAQTSARLVGLQEQVTGNVRPALIMLLAAVLLVLLIASTNVANLLMARSAARLGEMAVRSALGASAGRLFRQLITESVLLAVAGGSLGVVLGSWILSGLVAVSPANLPRLAEIHLDGRVLGFTILVTLVTGLVFGLLPALEAARAGSAQSLRATGRGLAGQGGMLRHSLVVAQMALALMLLVGASLLIRSFLQLRQVDSGFRTENILTAEVALPDARYGSPAKAEAFFAELLPRIRALPDVRSAGGVFGLPLTSFNLGLGFSIRGLPRPADGEWPESRVSGVTPGYLETMSVPLRRGRMIGEQDGPDAEGAIVVNESLARKYFPGENPVGRQIQLEGSVTDGPDRLRTIVGMVGDVRDENPALEPKPEMYVPYAQFPIGFMTLAVRTSGAPGAAAPGIAAALRDMDPNIPLSSIRTMGELTDASLAQPRFYMLLLACFAATALVLAAVGVYGVIAYGVSQRLREMGLRMALGATPGDVRALIVRQGFLLAVAGAVLGGVAALAASRLLARLLFGISATDPMTYAVTTGALLLAALAACVIPARRATRVDPMVALRGE
ncbi:MAG: ABC transporter permease [Gemmatimonadota bacterium]